jgi:hypothetical protein
MPHSAVQSAVVVGVVVGVSAVAHWGAVVVEISIVVVIVVVITGMVEIRVWIDGTTEVGVWIGLDVRIMSMMRLTRHVYALFPRCAQTLSGTWPATGSKSGTLSRFMSYTQSRSQSYASRTHSSSGSWYSL